MQQTCVVIKNNLISPVNRNVRALFAVLLKLLNYKIAYYLQLLLYIQIKAIDYVLYILPYICELKNNKFNEESSSATLTKFWYFYICSGLLIEDILIKISQYSFYKMKITS